MQSQAHAGSLIVAIVVHHSGCFCVWLVSIPQPQMAKEFVPASAPRGISRVPIVAESNPGDP